MNKNHHRVALIVIRNHTVLTSMINCDELLSKISGAYPPTLHHHHLNQFLKREKMSKINLVKKCAIVMGCLVLIVLIGFNLSLIEMTLLFHFNVQRSPSVAPKSTVENDVIDVTPVQQKNIIVMCDNEQTRVKISRLIDSKLINVLEHFDQLGREAKVAFVVSDPRQHVADFVQIKPDGNFTDEMKVYCQKIRENIDYLYENEKLQKIVRVFRIEDIFNEPEEIGQQFLHYIEQDAIEIKRQNYSKWRKVDFEIIHKTEQICKDIIKGSQNDLTNSYSLLHTINKNG